MHAPLLSEPMGSVAPDGTVFPVPDARSAQQDFETVRTRADAFRAAGGQVVVVQGLGFVGSAMAAVAADARRADESPAFFVIGTDLATPGSYWKVAKIHQGQAPFESPDPALPELLQRAAATGNLAATTCEEAYGLADVVVVDVPLDVEDRTTLDPADIRLNLAAFEAAIAAIGRHVRPEALVLVETTVPIGTTLQTVTPLLQTAFQARNLAATPRVAHAYERVMPGPRYVDSIRRFWRTFAAIDEPSRAQARAFLEAVVDTSAFPLRELEDPNASELAKLLENSYRAANIAFMHEWTLLAEALGVNLFDVVDSIRVRAGTHDNMRYPGFGVGGYCLTKDSLLAQWSLTHRFGLDQVLPMTLEALRTNHLMPRHTLELLRQLAGPLKGRTVAVLGLSYLAEVPDTRNTPTELLVEDLKVEGATVRLHDPVTRRWIEKPEIPIHGGLSETLAEADAVVLAIPHQAYRQRNAQEWRALLRPGAVLVDAQNILSDETARALHGDGHRLRGVGKGHWRREGLDQ